MKTQVIKSMVVVIIIGCLCAGAHGENGLVAHYPFDGESGMVIHDQSGQGHDGQIVGGAERVEGSWGSALKFDGTDDYVDCGKSTGLDLDGVGSISFWFKPQGTPQGGLVGWSAGADKSDWRQVTSLNSYTANKSRGPEQFEELGVYMADGVNHISLQDSNFHKAFFPPPSKWLFLTVTFNGRFVDIYRDGVHIYTRFEAVAPKTTDVPLWIGRCFGAGGPSDYFKGLMDEVRIYNRPLSDQEVYELFMRDANGRDKDTAGFGSINIKPTIMPRAGRVFADLDYRGLVPTSKNLVISADLLNKEKEGVVVQGKVRLLPAWGRAEVVFDVAKLPAGQYSIRAATKKGKSVDVAVTWPGRAAGWEDVKVLNNLCWELLNVSPGLNQKENYTFTNPRRGWVFIISESDSDITLSMSDTTPTLIRTADKTGWQEQMRWLPKGEQTIAVNGEGTLKTLIVRSVPSLVFCHYPHVAGTGNEHDFLAEYVLPHANILLTGDYDSQYNTDNYRQKWASEMGRRSMEELHTYGNLYPTLKPDTARQQIYDYLTGSGGMSNPEFHAVILNEFDPGDERMAWRPSYYDEWIDVCREIMADPKYTGRMIIPWYAYNLHDYEKSSEFLRAIIGLNSYIASEIYLHEQENAGKAWVFINEAMADLADDWEKAFPGAIEHMIVTPSWLEREPWNPEADFNVFIDMQFNHLATRPEFFGLAGIMPYQSHSTTEEYVRFGAGLFRHYGLEGNTGMSSDDPYTLDHIKNPDFIDGTIGWTIKPAFSDSVAVRTHKGYGFHQNRFSYLATTETTFLLTRRGKDKPNIISQQIKNLTPGRLYSVSFVTGDYQELIKGVSVEQEHPVSVAIENGDMYEDWYKTATISGPVQKKMTYRSLKPFDAKNRYCLNIHRYVFRAKGPTAKLILRDWKNADEPGGPVGQELMFNSIEVRPYFEGVN